MVIYIKKENVQALINQTVSPAVLLSAGSLPLATNNTTLVSLEGLFAFPSLPVDESSGERLLSEAVEFYLSRRLVASSDGWFGPGPCLMTSAAGLTVQCNGVC